METKDILKQLRLEKKLSMDELCEKLKNSYNLKITKSMISRWENGLANPNNTYLSAYAKFFNIDLNYLAGLTDARKPLNFIKLDTETQDDIITTCVLTSNNPLECEKTKKIKLAARNMNQLSDEDLDFVITMMEKLNKKKEK